MTQKLLGVIVLALSMYLSSGILTIDFGNGHHACSHGDIHGRVKDWPASMPVATGSWRILHPTKEHRDYGGYLSLKTM